MKVAILTQPLKSNYGGLLQAFALQRALNKLGHQPITIDRQINKKGFLRRLLSHIKYQALRVSSNPGPIRFSKVDQDRIFENTLEFIAQHIKLSSRIDTDDGMQKHFLDNKYQAIVVGSDQTWRPMYSPNIYNFYLDFLKDNTTKRVAYASSFGVENWEYSESQAIKCRDLANRFDGVSVRELSGVNLCRKYLNVDANFVLDPTLLLTASDYINHLNINVSESKKRTLFTYILDSNDDKEQSVKNTGRLLDLTIHTNQPRKSLSKGGNGKVDDYIFPKVETWVKSFHDAEFVVTDSFHGCVFSIIFNKPFLAIGNKDRGLARFDSLLKLLNLENRLITGSNQITPELLRSNIDWSAVNSILEKEKEKSLSFIVKHLSPTETYTTPIENSSYSLSKGTQSKNSAIDAH